MTSENNLHNTEAFLMWSSASAVQVIRPHQKGFFCLQHCLFESVAGQRHNLSSSGQKEVKNWQRLRLPKPDASDKQGLTYVTSIGDRNPSRFHWLVKLHLIICPVFRQHIQSHAGFLKSSIDHIFNIGHWFGCGIIWII